MTQQDSIPQRLLIGLALFLLYLWLNQPCYFCIYNWPSPVTSVSLIEPALCLVTSVSLIGPPLLLLYVWLAKRCYFFIADRPSHVTSVSLICQALLLLYLRSAKPYYFSLCLQTGSYSNWASSMGLSHWKVTWKPPLLAELTSSGQRKSAQAILSIY